MKRYTFGKLCKVSILSLVLVSLLGSVISLPASAAGSIAFAPEYELDIIPYTSKDTDLRKELPRISISHIMNDNLFQVGSITSFDETETYDVGELIVSTYANRQIELSEIHISKQSAYLVEYYKSSYSEDNLIGQISGYGNVYEGSINFDKVYKPDDDSEYELSITTPIKFSKSPSFRMARTNLNENHLVKVFRKKMAFNIDFKTDVSTDILEQVTVEELENTTYSYEELLSFSNKDNSDYVVDVERTLLACSSDSDIFILNSETADTTITVILKARDKAATPSNATPSNAARHKPTYFKALRSDTLLDIAPIRTFSEEFTEDTNIPLENGYEYLVTFYYGYATDELEPEITDPTLPDSTGNSGPKLVYDSSDPFIANELVPYISKELKLGTDVNGTILNGNKSMVANVPKTSDTYIILPLMALFTFSIFTCGFILLKKERF